MALACLISRDVCMPTSVSFAGTLSPLAVQDPRKLGSLYCGRGMICSSFSLLDREFTQQGVSTANPDSSHLVGMRNRTGSRGQTLEGHPPGVGTDPKRRTQKLSTQTLQVSMPTGENANFVTRIDRRPPPRWVTQDLSCLTVPRHSAHFKLL